MSLLTASSELIIKGAWNGKISKKWANARFASKFASVILWLSPTYSPI